MKRVLTLSIVAAFLLAIPDKAKASLIGDVVGYDLTITFVNFSVVSGGGTTIVGPGVEVDPIIANAPYLALDVMASSFELVYDDAVPRAIRTLEFGLTNLNWTDQPGQRKAA